MTKKNVLAIGIEPALADLPAALGLTPELIRSHIETQIERLRVLDYDAEICLIDLGETAERVTTAALESKHFDCVVIGAGLRQPASQLLLFEKSSTSFTPMPRPPGFVSTPRRPIRRKPCSAGSNPEG